MKGTNYVSGSIITVEDLKFTEDSKSHAIEQLGADLLENQSAFQPKGGIGATSVIVKGIVKNSGLTANYENEPLKVYITNKSVGVYSGIAYSSYEGKSSRIFVPDDPNSIPINTAAAAINHNNIDELTEVQVNEFIAGSRPPRENININGKTEFTSADPSGNYFICIKYVLGYYDSETIPNDGSLADTKMYDSYEIRISTSNAATLSAADITNWLPLATYSWDGTILVLVSDDRVYASCISSITDVLIVQHQNRYHENCVISEDHTKLALTVNNVTHQLTFTPPAFTGDEGILVNGVFIQTLSTSAIQFGTTMVSGNYYAYIDGEGVPRATTTIATATNGCILGSCYYNSATNTITLNISSTDAIVRDRRAFGSIGDHQLSTKILGESYNYLDDLKIKELSDELITHRDNNHGNGLWLASNVSPYGSGAGSLGVTPNGVSVTVIDISVGDKLYLDGWECTKVHGSLSVTPPNNTTTIIYAERQTIADNMHEIFLSYTANTTVTDNQYPICRVIKGAVNVTSVEDLRVYGTVGYWHTQRNSNINGLNNLPQLLTCIHGVTPSIAAGALSDTIHLTLDWKSIDNPTYYAGGGTGAAPQVFAAIPSITPYYDKTGLYALGYLALEEVRPESFKIRNLDSDPHICYWIAIGLPFENTITTVLQGKDNPRYYT
jgi:hypothetical protein